MVPVIGPFDYGEYLSHDYLLSGAHNEGVVAFVGPVNQVRGPAPARAFYPIPRAAFVHAHPAVDPVNLAGGQQARHEVGRGGVVLFFHGGAFDRVGMGSLIRDGKADRAS